MNWMSVLNQVPQGGSSLLFMKTKKNICNFGAWGEASLKRAEWNFRKIFAMRVTSTPKTAKVLDCLQMQDHFCLSLLNTSEV